MSRWLLALAVGCGGPPRPVAAPPRPMADAAVVDTAAPVADAAGVACLETDSTTPLAVIGGSVTIARCTLDQHETHGGWTVATVRTTLTYAAGGAVASRVIEEADEDHDEYYAAVAWALSVQLGRAVIAERASHGVALHAYLLDGLVDVDLGSYDGVEVTVVDATTATVTPCTQHGQSMSGFPDGPCDPDPSFALRWTGQTIERVP